MKKGRKPKKQPVSHNEGSGSEMEDIEESSKSEDHQYFKPECTIKIKFSRKLSWF